jgi:hypothetical protein
MFISERKFCTGSTMDSILISNTYYKQGFGWFLAIELRVIHIKKQEIITMTAIMSISWYQAACALLDAPSLR